MEGEVSYTPTEFRPRKTSGRPWDCSLLNRRQLHQLPAIPQVWGGDGDRTARPFREGMLHRDVYTALFAEKAAAEDDEKMEW